MRALRRPSQFTVFNAALVAVILTQSVIAQTATQWWLRGLASSVLILASVTLGGHLVLDAIRSGERETTGTLPRSINVTRGDDGAAVAFVERVNGESLALPVPEGIVEQGPAAVYLWITTTLIEDAP